MMLNKIDFCEYTNEVKFLLNIPIFPSGNASNILISVYKEIDIIILPFSY